MLTSDNNNPSAIVCKKSQTVCTETRKLHDILLETLDVLLSCLVVAPCVVSYWRGTWELIGVLVFPGNVPLSALSSFLIGGLGHLVFTLSQNYFRSNIHPDQHRLTYYVFSRCYTAVFGIVCVNMWRGAWILCDWLTSADSLIIIYIVTLVALLFLVATRTVRNLGAAPYTVAMDHKADYFDVGTMFKIPGFHQPALFILDTLFSVFVIGTLVVIAWRGLWGIMDFTLYPEDRKKSYWASMILGYITAFFTFAIRPFVRCICRWLDDGIIKLALCDVFYFFVFFGAVNVWRGIWNLLDIYLYPDDKILSYWITHVIPFLILAAIKCSNSILVRGVFIDAENDEKGDCVSLPVNYVKLHFERERSKKISANIKSPAAGHHYYKTEEKLTINRKSSESQASKREAQRMLLPKDNNTKVPKIQKGMDCSNLV